MKPDSDFQPPWLLSRFLGLILSPGDREEKSGDLEEVYRHLSRETGRTRAGVWYLMQVLKVIPRGLANYVRWSSVMFTNYLRIAWRNVLRNKVQSFISIFGLALGLAGSLLIMLWVMDEISYDRFHENADHLYRAEFYQNYSGNLFHVNVSPQPLGPAVKEQIPEVEDSTRITRLGEVLVNRGDLSFVEARNFVVDSSFFRMFTFPILQGEASNLFPNPNSIVISTDLAKKYFGEEDPLGQELTINTNRHFVITGVMENVPSNSTLRFDLAIPFQFLESTGNTSDNWDSNSILTFVQLRPGADPEEVAGKIHALVGEHIEVDDLTHSLNPLTDIHLYNISGFGNVSGTAQYVFLFTAVALFVLIVACLNFMNLATARSSLRAREVGLRKVVGARRGQLIRQFYGETMLAGFLALGLALGIIALALPFFNELVGKSLTMAAFLNPRVVLSGFSVLLFTCFLAGSYPALFLSRFRPARVLRSGGVSTATRGKFRKALVVTQFALSIGLICATGVVYSQLQYMYALDPGYDRDHVLCLPIRGGVAGEYRTLKQEFSRVSGVRGVTAASHRPSSINSNSGGADWDGRNPDHDISLYCTWVDFDYLITTGIELAAGRDYSEDRPSDITEAFVINEAAARIMGMESPVGARLKFADKEGRIIGVARDFHFESLHSAIEPLVMLIGQPFFSTIMIRLEPGYPKEVLAGIENVWRRLVPEYPFDYSFLNQEFDAMYRAENRMGDVMTGFAIFALFIACLGLFGLAAFAAERRTREIGIRKVLGASTNQTVGLLCREFVILVAISVLIAWPLVGWLMSIWLADFAYRTDLPLDLFFWSAVITLVIALLTVSSQAVRAAATNPVKALRHE